MNKTWIYLILALGLGVLTYVFVFKKDGKCMLVNLALPNNTSPFFITLALLKGELDPLESEEPDDSRIIPRFIMPLASGYKLTFQLRSVMQQGNDT